MQLRNRRRLQFLLVVSMFFAPLIIASILAMRGWVPDARSFGEPILPQRSLQGVAIELADGGDFQWRDPDQRWRLVALPGSACAERCIEQLDLIHRAQFLLNKNAHLVQLVYLGTPPIDPAAASVMQAWRVGRDRDDALAEWRAPEADGVAAILVQPDGTPLTLYRNGFNPTGLRKDLAKVAK